MGWELQQKGEKFRFYSNNSDEYITEWGDKNDVLCFLAYNELEKAKLKTIEHWFSFPHQWPNHDEGRTKTRLFSQHQGMSAYYEWVIAASKEENFPETVEKKYQEVLKGIGYKEVYP